jgi:Na+/proline symporter
MGEAPEVDTILDEGAGWGVVIGFGLFFTIFSVGLTKVEEKVLGTTMSSEMFNTAGRSIGAGLTAAVIVSQWTWAATLLMSSNMGWRVGVSGPFWYASGATVQILLFAILAIQVKRRASHMHTFMEIVKARFGTITHCIMIVFALMANCIVTAMLLLGGSATIADLTGMSKIWAAFLIPLLSCWIYTMHGGLKATFFASYVHTTVIFLMLIIFTFSVYAGAGDSSNLYGTPDKVYDGLEAASLHGFTRATVSQSAYPPSNVFANLESFIENAGTCYKNNGGTWENSDKFCNFAKRGLSEWCCASTTTLSSQTYCRSNTADCIDLSSTLHYESTGCDFNAGEVCVTSFATMNSPSGLLFGITNIVGNFGTVFVDQSYWQSAVAAKPKSAVLGFLIGGMVWFAVPFCMATTNGLVGRALTTHPDLTPLYIDAGSSGSGLTPARALSKILGEGGAAILLLQLFMAITSTGSAEIIAVSSILTYDIYYEYINPELKGRREALRVIFNAAVSGSDKEGQVALSALNPIMQTLVSKGFFEKAVPQNEVADLAAAISSFTVNNAISTSDLYSCVNRAVCSNSLEGKILLRVSKFFTAVFAIFMGFLAVFLQTLGFSLGWVYMSMGVIIGSAVGPASLTILMETANSIAIAAGAVGGLALGLMGWCIKASVDNEGVVAYETLGQDWPWVVGNVCAILGGLLISLVGSLAMPDKEFKWSMLNERIPLVDDIEPPKESSETDEKLQMHVKVSIAASVGLTIILLVIWPLPMHYGGGVFSKGGFTTWVVLEMLWAIIGGIVIIGLPLVETIMGFMSAKKARATQAEQVAAGSCKLPDDSTLSIPASGQKIEGI